jgi:hypothetical protein
MYFFYLKLTLIDTKNESTCHRLKNMQGNIFIRIKITTKLRHLSQKQFRKCPAALDFPEPGLRAYKRVGLITLGKRLFISTTATATPLTRIIHVPPCTADLSPQTWVRAFFLLYGEGGGSHLINAQIGYYYIRSGAGSLDLTSHAGT